MLRQVGRKTLPTFAAASSGMRYQRTVNLCIPLTLYSQKSQRKWNCLQVISVNLLKSRGLRTSTVASVKLYQDTENGCAHKILENLPAYRNTLVCNDNQCECIDEVTFKKIVDTDWHNETPHNTYTAFKQLSDYGPVNGMEITDTLFDNICESVVDKCSEMTDSDLLGVLLSLSKWPLTDTTKSKNFCPIWNAVDKVCVLRVKQWDLNQVLLVADHWYKLHLARICSYTWHSNLKLGRKPSRLTPAQLVQTMFYINVHRKLHPAISAFEFEYSLEQCIDKLTVEEIGIIAMGFFKTQTQIHNQNLVLEIVRRTEKELKTINDTILASILKMIRYSLRLTHTDRLYHLLDQLLPHIDRFGLLTCVHIALVGTHTQTFHEGVMQKIAERFVSHVKSIRIKDIERLSFAFTLFDYDPPTEPYLYKAIVSQLYNTEREQEFSKHPKCISRCVYFLTMKEIYLKDLISKVLNPLFIRETYGKNKYHIDREILCLDACVEIECPDYQGNRIDPKLRDFLIKKYAQWVPCKLKNSHSNTNRMLLEVLDACTSLFGDHSIYAGHILPHYDRPDISFYMTTKGEAAPIPDELIHAPLSKLKYPLPMTEDGQWFTIVIGGWNTYTASNQQLLGMTKCKLRNLKTIGYCPVYIPLYEWKNIPPAKRQMYLQQKIASLQISHEQGVSHL